MDYRIKNNILLTMHRRENWGKPMEEILKAIKDYLNQRNDFYLVFPYASKSFNKRDNK